MQKIKIIGCREHNLKNINVEIPRNKLIVFSGVSGSGKTSLAIDTIHAEGKRKYMESLSAYSRQFLGLMPKPDVDEIFGLSPSIAITQKNSTQNPRSIVATSTEIYDYLRVLFAKIGDVYSPITGEIIKAYTITEIVNIISCQENTKLLIIAPIPIVERNAQNLIDTLLQQGFKRIFIHNTVADIENIKYSELHKLDVLQLIVDRVISNTSDKTRLSSSIELAMNLSHGMVWTCSIVDDNQDNIIQKYSSKYVCPESGFAIDSLDPSMFSFNSPNGACEECKGIGEKIYFSEDLIIPNQELSIQEFAIQPGFKFSRENYIKIFEDICTKYKTSIHVPFKDLSANTKKSILYGISDKIIKFKGVIPELIALYNRSESEFLRGYLNNYKSTMICPVCNGTRLKQKILNVKILGQSIYDVINLTIVGAIDYIKKVEHHLCGNKKTIAASLIREILLRLQFLVDVGLEYITLNRTSSTLSGGEMQRISLASQLGSGLTGVLFVLDEPSIGLHPIDTARLIKVLLNLRDNGNTIIVIEHEELIIKAADYIVDVGPAAGELGGEIVFSGYIKNFESAQHSLTSDYIFKRKHIEITASDRDINALPKKFLELKGVTTNNLQNIDVQFPLGLFNCVTGVSGSGKSSLIMDTLLPALKHTKYLQKKSAKYKSIVGENFIDSVIEIDQTPIGRTPRSNPITYIDGFTVIRELFASLPESRVRGYKIGRFSFNVKGGRCEACEGDGFMKVSMHFLPDVFVQCEYCNGTRYNNETLEIQYNGKTISDVLNMTVDDAFDFFKNVSSIKNKLLLLQQVGLGYIRLGQSATTLSGGEAQRIKLAKELSKKMQGNTLYILDEPTTGLHFEDIKKLLIVLKKIVEKGNTLIIIEHNMDLIRAADWIIDLGNKSGIDGGRIVDSGTVIEIQNRDLASIAKFINS